MILVTVIVTPECENLISALPHGYEYELDSEEYVEDGSGRVSILIHDVADTTSGMEAALNSHPGVIRYSVIEVS